MLAWAAIREVPLALSCRPSSDGLVVTGRFPEYLRIEDIERPFALEEAFNVVHGSQGHFLPGLASR